MEFFSSNFSTQTVLQLACFTAKYGFVSDSPQVLGFVKSISPIDLFHCRKWFFFSDTPKGKVLSVKYLVLKKI